MYKLVTFAVLLVFLLATGLQSGNVDVHGQWNNLVHGTVSRPLGGGVPIRLMYIGASVTLGEHSDGERGYRKQVRDWIASLGNPVNCVGGNRYGEFADNDVQAWGAQPIKPTLDRARQDVPALQPNLILVNAGSSDCFQEDHWGSSNVLNHMRDLIHFLFEASPRAAIVLSTIVVSPWDHVDRCVRSANAQIRQVAVDLAREGHPILLAEMHSDQGINGTLRPEDIGPDNMHPTTDGYLMMGHIFEQAILEVDRRDWLQPPVENGVPHDGNAERAAEGVPNDEVREEMGVVESKTEQQKEAEAAEGRLGGPEGRRRRWRDTRP